MDLPGRDRDLFSLVRLYERVLASGRGRIVFLVGDEESGRRALLEAFVDRMGEAASRPTVLAGGFDATGVYLARPGETPSARAGAICKRLIDLGEPVATLAEGVLPYGALLGQILSRSTAALTLAEQIHQDSRPPDLSVLMPRTLRTLANERPVVCVVDDVDQAQSGWWADLVVLFARRVADDLPLLIVLGVEGPSALGSHDDDEPDVLFVARTLVADDLASWHPLARVGIEDMCRWTNEAAPEVARALLDITHGRAAWAAALWRDWQRRRVVELRDDGRWVFTGGRRGAADEVEDRFGQRLKGLLGAPRLEALVNTQALLACAALEGRRFTADAVAWALERDRDDVIDELDDKLTHHDARPDGIVVEDSLVEVHDEVGDRSLWRYRFRSELDWLALRYHGFTDAERPRRSLRLAQAMEALYGSEAHRAAPTLARLYRAAGNTGRAAYFQRMSDIGVSRTVTLWRARQVLAAPHAKNPAERSRSSHVLLAAAWALFGTGPFAECRQFAQAAHGLATVQSDQAQALYLIGSAEHNLGEHGRALTHLNAARTLFADLGDRDGEAATRFALAQIEVDHGRYDSARPELDAVLALFHKVGNRAGEAGSRSLVARIDAAQGRYDAARRELDAAVALFRQLGDRDGEAGSRFLLAQIDVKQGRYDSARRELDATLVLNRELGDRAGEVSGRLLLAQIDVNQGRYGAARRELDAVRALSRQLGDRDSEVGSRFLLAEIDVIQGRYGAARRELDAVLALYGELGNRDGEAAARHLLAQIDVDQRRYDAARPQLDAVLALNRKLGDRDGEAAARHMLARIDIAQARYDEARRELDAVLALNRELGDRPGEAAARQLLAFIDVEQGRYDVVRPELDAVLALCRKLGDRDGEAATRQLLARIDVEQGRYEVARRELDAVLAIYRELGNRDGEASSRQLLARIAVEQE
jgi:tetratricopeptide (TPR) repeat protein